MKRWSVLFILAIFLLLVAGCSKNESFRNTNTETFHNTNNNTNDNGDITRQPYPRHDKLINSRFVSDSVDLQTGKPHQIAVSDIDYEYYQPAELILAKSLIPEDTEKEINRNTVERGAFSTRPLLPMTSSLLFTTKTSPEVFFTAVFDNDIFDYTDYYYTNGICLELYHPAISASPICRILPGLKNSLNYYGLILIQNMYTPRKLEELEIRVGDRPFAAYLTISHKRISLSSDQHRRLESELALGAIGPASLGDVAQDMIHTNTPVGWVNQVKNDAVVNYSIRFDQSVYSGKGLEIAVITGGQAGTLYDNIMAGLYLQMGKTNDLYRSLFQTTPHQKTFKGRVRYYFSLDAKTKLVMYDATLQGGMFNRESVYKFNASQVKHCVFTGIASVGLGLGRYSLLAEQVFLTPEFDGGRHHFWFRIKNIFYLN